MRAMAHREPATDHCCERLWATLGKTLLRSIIPNPDAGIFVRSEGSPWGSFPAKGKQGTGLGDGNRLGLLPLKSLS